MDASKFSERIELDVEDGSPEQLAIKVVMQEGALRFQEQVVDALRKAGKHDAVEIVEQVEFNVSE